MENQFSKGTVENASLRKAVSDKTMTTQEKCVKNDFVAPLMAKVTPGITDGDIS